MSSEPTQYIAFLNGSNVGTFRSISEAHTAACQAAGRGMKGPNGESRVEIRDSKHYQVVAMWPAVC
ncbi:MAG: hypothetical protein JHC33_12480 [Ignisphaera sp.]|jgi:hypothetical protein|nr:hypothetical protein [Ignisphaera sp.]